MRPGLERVPKSSGLERVPEKMSPEKKSPEEFRFRMSPGKKESRKKNPPAFGGFGELLPPVVQTNFFPFGNAASWI